MIADTPRTDAEPCNQPMLSAQSDPIELYQKLCSLSVLFEKSLDACVEYRKQLDEAEAEVEWLKDLCDWAETLLCNAEPPKHSTEEEWSQLVTKFRSELHLITRPTETIACGDYSAYSPQIYKTSTHINK